MSDFIRPRTLKDLVTLILKNKHLDPETLFNLIITDNHTKTNASRQGFLYESIIRICIVFKCFEGLHYTFFEHGKTTNFKHLKNIRELLEENLHKGHDSGSDIIIQQENDHIFITVKYRDTKYDITDLVSMFSQKKDSSINEFRCCVIVKDYKNIPNTHDKDSNEYKLIEQVIKNKLLFTTDDVIKSLSKVMSRCKDIDDIADFIELINKDYLNNPRKLLTLRLHQKMFLIRFINRYSKNKKLTICLKNKPRSGKTILMLCIAKYLLENDCKKIIIVTPIVATLEDFIKNLNNFLDFKDILYSTSNEFDKLDENFNGIFLCSSQFLKNDINKEKLKHFKNINFDAYMGDEYHLGGTTSKTQKICHGISTKIFASGTPDKVITSLNLLPEDVFTWEQNEVMAMKNFNNGDENAVVYLKNKYPEFKNCLEDKTLNIDYSDTPSQCYIKHSLSPILIKMIDDYNIKNNTNYGYDLKSIFALETSKDGKYLNKFKICRTEHGKELLKQLLESIISGDPNKKTLMTVIEKTQHDYDSRKSCKENPLLFLIYLPTHTNNNTIEVLQKTLTEFIKNNKLWNKFYISYSNGTSNSLCSKDYNAFMGEILKKTTECEKDGCVLFLGDQGGVGVTYNECDVTISLDDSHNLNTKIQRDSRALTPAHNKTIGINCDMNSHRYLSMIYRNIKDYKKYYKSNDPDHIILKKMFDEKFFICDPHMFSRFSRHDAIKYYEEFCKDFTELFDETKLLDQITCDKILPINFKETKSSIVNPEIQGDNLDLSRAGKDEVSNDIVTKNKRDEEEDKQDEDEDEEEDKQDEDDEDNKKQICDCFKIILPVLALFSRNHNNKSFKEILKTEEKLMDEILSKKSIYGNKIDIYIMIDYMLDRNYEIVEQIRTLYEISPPEKIRELVAKHFIPSIEERKTNAEVPTPIKFVDNMINIIDKNFWKTKPKILEPCCGKGNFLLALFDILYEHLECIYIHPYEICKVIIEECLYFIDISPLNVFITTELLKCHVQSYCGIEYVDFEFNKMIGDSLLIKIDEQFDLVIGNPPYNSSGDTATGNTIWQHFTKKGLNEWLLPNGYLLFVHPPGWRKPNTERGKFYGLYKLMTQENQMIYLSIHGIKDGQKTFNCGTRYDWYLIEKTNQYKNTIIVDEDGKQNEINLSELSWLPNSNILEINKILAKNDDERCPIMYDRTAYGSDKKDRVSSKETPEFKYPCVHSTPKAGIRYMYSKVNDRGHFGVSKVIFGESGIYKPVIDMEGKYGMTNGAMAIQVDNLEEATFISKVIESDKFDKVIQSCLFSSFRIDWNIFKEFKKDFWKEFI